MPCKGKLRDNTRDYEHNNSGCGTHYCRKATGEILSTAGWHADSSDFADEYRSFSRADYRVAGPFRLRKIDDAADADRTLADFGRDGLLAWATGAGRVAQRFDCVSKFC